MTNHDGVTGAELYRYGIRREGYCDADGNPMVSTPDTHKIVPLYVAVRLYKQHLLDADLGREEIAALFEGSQRTIPPQRVPRDMAELDQLVG